MIDGIPDQLERFEREQAWYERWEARKDEEPDPNEYYDEMMERECDR